MRNYLLSSALVQISVHDVTPFRGKSKHIIFLEIARIAMKEALDSWNFIPRRLLYLLAEGCNPDRSDPWDPILLSFIKMLSNKYPSFELLKETPKPIDRQRRGLNKLLDDVNKIKNADGFQSDQLQSSKSCDLSKVILKKVVLEGSSKLKGSIRGRKSSVVIWCHDDDASITTVKAAKDKLDKWNMDNSTVCD